LNIQYLDISNNAIEDLKPLNSLVHLRDLYADDNRITDISPLFTMKGLVTISLQNNYITTLNIEYLNDK